MSARSFRILFTEQAQNDIQEIWLYSLSNWGPEQADDYDDALHRSFDRLRRHPWIGRPREDLRRGLRGLVVREHLLLYRIEGDAVIVQHIIHQRQDLSPFQDAD